ncbi:acyltransferase [Methanoculleus sp. 10]|jgi:UDP-2-acetamido-3-amino-2,3-dideoxy-glucuronate N-acetyltransferase|uniref:acyltransferase n=1 Tax=Methanoculleus sp. 10 TaxID=430615 RepID=UPI00182EB13B|nr:acyltransferase [Methanoculleus sp. 10]NMB51037.1 N-acetyltransferase [Bacteroidales bacterium]
MNNEESRYSIINNVTSGEGTSIKDLVNLYGCDIGKNCKIDSFVYIEGNVKIGDNCKIRAFTFIPSGVTIEDNVFIGPCVVFTNDKFPRSTNENGELKKERDWKLEQTVVKRGASIGANSTIIGPVSIGKGSMVGAGSVVTKDVEDGQVVIGVPAKPYYK